MSPDPLPTGPFSEVLISVSLWYAAASVRGSAAFRRSVRRTLPSMWTVVVIIARARRSLAHGLRSCRRHCTACTRRYALDHSARRNLPPGKSCVVRNLDKLDLAAYREKRLGRDKVPCSCARSAGQRSRRAAELAGEGAVRSTATAAPPPHDPETDRRRARRP
jgi:hypothetical protein